MDGSDNKLGTRREASQNNSTEAQITSTKEAAQKIINNELPINSVEDIDNIIAKIPDEIEPNITGHTHEDILKDGEEWLSGFSDGRSETSTVKRMTSAPQLRALSRLCLRARYM